jgi:hypothetical protein
MSDTPTESMLDDRIAELEDENAELRKVLVQCEDALRHALIMSPLDPFQRGKVITAALDKTRATLDAARKEQP